MIRISVYKDAQKVIREFRCEGHAGYAEAGHDIICSAVSVLVINTINSIEKLTATKLHQYTDERLGIISFNIDGDVDEKADVLLNSLELGLIGIKQDYGKRFINISIKEV